MELEPKEKTIVIANPNQIAVSEVGEDDPIVIYENDKLIGCVYYTGSNVWTLHTIYDLYDSNSLEDIMINHLQYTFKILYGEKV